MDLAKVKNYAFNLHDVEVNQKYAGTLPYSFHLRSVSSFVYKFSEVLTPYEELIAIAGAFLHDSIEDARKTYNDISELFGNDVADIVYCCTEDKGKNRDERHSDRFYEELSKNEVATYVKLCDICANVTFSLATNSDMFEKYKSEYPKLKARLFNERFINIFNFLEKHLF